ncbi:hypothetical protein BaRGS_00019324 [Batillaria attramentaria]|uniref:Uncharacterized protein n=1 Tax=Batillaria attramentaria TaxID=370345 RepID=A0ABD0KQJ7_9CAEN
MDIVTRCTSYHSSSTISAQTKSKSSRFVRHRSSTSYAQSKTIPSRCALMVHLQQVPSVKSSQRTMSQLIYVRCPDKNNTVTIPFTSHLRHNSPTSDDRASQLNVRPINDTKKNPKKTVTRFSRTMSCLPWAQHGAQSKAKLTKCMF